MYLNTYINIIKHRWWLLILGPVMAGCAAFYVSKQMTPIYQTSATLLINQMQNPGVIQYNDILTSERLTNTYAQLLKRQGILDEVVSTLHLEISSAQLDDSITVSTVSNTQLLRIGVENPNPVLASQIANTIARVFIDDNSRSLARPGTVSIAEEAPVPATPAKPNVKLNTMLAAALGLMAVGALAVLFEYLDDTVKAGAETEIELGLPTLGLVRKLKRRAQGAAPFGLEASEAYVQLRTNVHFAGVGKKLNSIAITSGSPGEGKSTTAAGLAMALAQAGERVILVDTDLRRPTQHHIFSIPNSFGLTGLLLGDAYDAGPALIESGVKNLSILPSGPIPPNPADLLMSTSMERLMETMHTRADYVIYDTPPVLAVSDASILGGRVDGVILVSLTGSTRKSVLRQAMQDLRRAQSTVIGLVVNKVRSANKYYYYNYKSRPEDNTSRTDAADVAESTRRRRAA